MKIKTKIIKVGQAINQEITLPILIIGSGKPVFGFVTGIHGNEPEGLFILKEFVSKLNGFKGTIKILPGANPFGLINNSRVGAFDYLDLNRSFPGKINGTLTQRIAALIFKEFSDCDLVFDIHSVTNVGLFMGLEMSTTNPKFIKMTKKINRLLSPQVIWRAVEGKKYENALDETILAAGICGIGVEVPRMEFLTDQLVESIVYGFIKIINNPKKVNPLPKPIPILANAQRFFSNQGGIYTPIMNVLDPVKIGDLVGIITDLTTFKDFPLKSQFSGILFVQSARKVLKTGDKIYVVTEKVGGFR